MAIPRKFVNFSFEKFFGVGIVENLLYENLSTVLPLIEPSGALFFKGSVGSISKKSESTSLKHLYLWFDFSTFPKMGRFIRGLPGGLGFY